MDEQPPTLTYRGHQVEGLPIPERIASGWRWPSAGSVSSPTVVDGAMWPDEPAHQLGPTILDGCDFVLDMGWRR